MNPFSRFFKGFKEGSSTQRGDRTGLPDASLLGDWDMPRGHGAGVELRTRVLRCIFLVDRRGGCPAEHVLVREFEGLEGYVRFLVIQIFLPEPQQLVLRQRRIEQCSD